MATLKNMTRVGADVRQIARLLQAKAPENHMLAYITPEEAQLLKNRGGTGMPDPQTGIPTYFVPDSESFEPGASLQDMQYPQSENIEVNVGSVAPVGRPDFANISAFETAPSVEMDSGPQFAVPSQFDSYSNLSGKFGEVVNPYAATQEAVSFEAVKQPPATLGQKYNELSKYLGISPETLGRVGIAGISSLYGAYQAKQARDDAAAAKRQQEALAIPYQTKGQELQRQAQAGELTAVGQQQLKAVQAQAAQSSSARGGVGAQQTAARVEAIRNQLLQQQNDYGLKLSGIGDQILLGAIRTGLEADRYVNQLSNTYFTNVARTLAGSPTVIQYGVTQ
jgi:hypothetical protein